MKTSERARSVEPSQLGFFFAFALGGTWLLQLPAVLAQRGVLPGGVERYVLPALVGAFAPLIAALLATRRETGSALGPLLRTLLPAKLGVHWYLLALCLFGAIHLAGVAGYRLLGGDGSLRWLYLPETAQHVLGMLLVPLLEEPAWRGFALPRLEARFGVLRASLVLGVLWAAWHTMMFLLPAPSATEFGISAANIVAGSVVFSWLYNRTHGSLLIALFAHAGAHLNNPAHAPPGSPAMLVYTLAICGVGAALVVFNPNDWRKLRRAPS
jgi:membrane protease YdiL (CAAX protease family)